MLCTQTANLTTILISSMDGEHFGSTYSMARAVAHSNRGHRMATKISSVNTVSYLYGCLAHSAYIEVNIVMQTDLFSSYDKSTVYIN